jgi:hypothetical protein
MKFSIKHILVLTTTVGLLLAYCRLAAELGFLSEVIWVWIFGLGWWWLSSLPWKEPQFAGVPVSIMVLVSSGIAFPAFQPFPYQFESFLYSIVFPGIASQVVKLFFWKRANVVEKSVTCYALVMFPIVLFSGGYYWGVGEDLMNIVMHWGMASIVILLLHAKICTHWSERLVLLDQFATLLIWFGLAIAIASPISTALVLALQEKSLGNIGPILFMVWTSEAALWSLNIGMALRLVANPRPSWVAIGLGMIVSAAWLAYAVYVFIGRFSHS